MDHSYYSSQIRHISRAAKEAKQYMEDYHAGKIKSLRTDLHKLNHYFLNGIEWNRILTIGAMSGSGKSVLCEQIKRSALFENNIPFVTLSFEFEMPAQDQIMRTLSSEMNVPVRELLLNKDLFSSQEVQKRMDTILSRLSNRPFYYNEEIGNVDDIVLACKEFAERKNLKEEKLGLVITIDHVLLTAGKEGQKEREIIAELYRKIIALKKYFVNQGIPVIFILLSQLNRNIETPERLLNPDLHFPTRNDLFGSNDIFMGSDYVLIIHKPLVLKLSTYGKNGWPVVDEKTGRPFIYFHLIKQRFGEVIIFRALDAFENAKILNYE